MIIKNANIFRDGRAFERGDIIIAGEFFAEAPGSGDVLDASCCLTRI